MKNYKDLEIYSLSYDLAIKVHKMSLKLPKYKMYEEGSQFLDEYNKLGGKINKFIKYIENEWQ